MNTIQMSDCEIKTNEWTESFPTVGINAKFYLLRMQSIESVNLQKIKEEITKIIAENITFKVSK